MDDGFKRAFSLSRRVRKDHPQDHEHDQKHQKYLRLRLVIDRRHVLNVRPRVINDVTPARQRAVRHSTAESRATRPELFEPIITPMDCANVSSPPLTSAMTRMIVTDDESRMVVATNTRQHGGEAVGREAGEQSEKSASSRPATLTTTRSPERRDNL
jgi:hypothetical protein